MTPTKTTAILIGLLCMGCTGYVREIGTPAAPDDMESGDAGLPPADAYRSAPQLRDPGSDLDTIEYVAQNTRSRPRWGDALTDPVQHLPDGLELAESTDYVAFAQEASREIHAHLRGNYDVTDRGAAGFYLLDDRAALVDEPPVSKSTVAAFVPESLRGPLYEPYVTGSPEHEEHPSFLLDEWVSATNGGTVAVDRVSGDLWREGSRDAFAAQLELTAYALAVGMAVERIDPVWFRDYRQFRELLAYQTRRALSIYRQGAAMSELVTPAQQAYYEELRVGQGAAELRAFVNRAFGTDFQREVFALD